MSQGLKTRTGFTPRRTSSARPLLRRAARNLAYLVGGRSVSGVFSIVYLGIAVQSLGIEAYGQLVLIYAFAQLVTAVVQFQTWQPILHFGTSAYQEGRYDDFCHLIRFTISLDAASALVSAVVVAGGVWLLGPYIGLPPEALPLASSFGLAVPFMTWATSRGLLRLFDRFNLLLLEDNVEAAVRLVGSVVALVFGGGLAAFVLVWGLSVIASSGTCAFLAWREVRRSRVWRPKDGIRVPASRRFPGIWHFIWSTNINSTVKIAHTHLTTVLIGGTLASADAGLYRIAQQISTALSKPLKLMIQVIYPELARLVAERNFALLRALARRTLLYSGGAALAVFAVIAVIGPLLLDVIGGHAAEGAYGMLLFLSATSLVRLSTFSFEPMLISLGRPSVALAVQLVVTAIYLPSLLIMMPRFGFSAVGIAVLGAAILTALLQCAAVAFWLPAETPASSVEEVQS